MRNADSERRSRLNQIDDQLNNLRAIFAIALLLSPLCAMLAVLQRKSSLLAACCVGVAVLGWCLIMRYRLIREHDRISRGLSWLGLEKFSAQPSVALPGSRKHIDQVLDKENA